MQKKSNAIRTISFLLCVSVVSLSAALYYRYKADGLTLQVEQHQQEAYSQLLDHVSNLETALQKARYSNSAPMLSQLAAQVWRESAGASAALSTLPLTTNGLLEVQKFVNQTGEYAFTLIRRNGVLGDEEYTNLSALYQSADSLCSQLMDYQATLGQDLAFGSQAQTVSAFDSDTPQQAEYPSLVYDGPFSDHLDRRTSLYLEGQASVTKQQAIEKAAAFAVLEEDSLQVTGETAGTIPCWQVQGGDIAMQVTKQGGHVLLLTDGRTLGAPQMTAQQGAQQAAAFLERHGFAGMKQSYYEATGGIVTVNFASQQDGRTLYPDLVKVSIALDTGEVVGFESRGYLMNHRERQLAVPQISLEQARQSLSPLLTVEREGQALIPSAGEREVDCYEFVCRTPENTHCIVYIDAQTGAEQNILLLLEGANGVLTA